MNGCGVVFVAEFGPTPDQDRLERCTRADCREHDVQLGWVRDEGLLLRYADQVRRFEQQRAARVDQEALL
jgi:hypothetical protein